VSSGVFVSIGSISQGTVTVTGAGSTLINTGAPGLEVGVFGTGVLTIANGGTVTASGSLGTTVALASGSTGTVNLNSGGILQTRALTAGSGTARVNFDGGTLRALASVPGFVTGFSGTALNIASGGLTIDDAGFTVATAGASFWRRRRSPARAGPWSRMRSARRGRCGCSRLRSDAGVDNPR
jgi:fibronectin-binding autotransporter adhesin